MVRQMYSLLFTVVPARFSVCCLSVILIQINGTEGAEDARKQFYKNFEFSSTIPCSEIGVTHVSTASPGTGIPL